MAKTSKTEKATDLGDKIIGTDHNKTTISDGTRKAVGRDISSEKSQKIASDKWDRGETSSASCSCYLMTACAKALNLTDDTIEQKALLDMQQNYLMKSLDGKKSLVQYYKLSPKIVSAINQKEESKAIWQGVYEQIGDVANKILAGNFKEGFETYKNLTLSLEKKYL